ncbi:Y-family DNA polymerase [Candidatus Dojkabacteria bacterium]|nr:Y-family DNA polymerase [Candidatus Dojkabacteria bacterium]
MSEKIYALIDCDNFYVSCERVFRPDLRDKPVIVLSNNDGCIISRSNEVKQLGIEMGTAYFKIMDIIKKYDIKIFSSNYPLYADLSNRIVKTLEMFSPNIEVYSIDESFLQLSIGKHDCTKYCKEIRERILKNTGIPTTIGIAYTKTLTKVASKIAKKNKEYNGVLSLLNTGTNDKYLQMVEVNDVWGVGRKYSKWLEERGIYTARDLKYADKEYIRKKMTVNGYRTVMELNNIECLPLEKEKKNRKSIVDSKSFGKLTDSLDDIKKSLALDVTRAGEKLRAQNCLAGFLTVFLTTSPFRDNRYSNSISIKLPYPVSDSSTLIKYAFLGLEKIFRQGYLYKKTGVILTDISSVKDVQLNFNVNCFLQHTEKQNQIMNSIDRINKKWGRDTVTVGALGLENNLKMRQNMKSPRYTTNWEEILNVHI